MCMENTLPSESVCRYRYSVYTDTQRFLFPEVKHFPSLLHAGRKQAAPPPPPLRVTVYVTLNFRPVAPPLDAMGPWAREPVGPVKIRPAPSCSSEGGYDVRRRRPAPPHPRSLDPPARTRFTTARAFRPPQPLRFSSGIASRDNRTKT